MLAKHQRIGLWALLLAACATTSVRAASPPTQQGVWTVYQDSHTSQTIPCVPNPILLNGSHTDLKLVGDCNYVRVAGEHNDIYIELGAGATIEITGEHNDVTWHQIVQGRPPRLLATPESNTFHDYRP